MPKILSLGADRELSPTESVASFSAAFDRRLSDMRRNALVLSSLAPHARQSAGLAEPTKAEPASETRGEN